MAQTVQGVVARGKGEPVELEPIVVPDPGPGRGRGATSRRAGCAIPTCTTARAASTTSSRSCSGTRRPAWSRAVGDGRHRGGAGRLRDPELAGGVRRVPRVPPRPALVLLRHPQREPEDDPRRRHRAQPGARHRRLRREDAGAAGQCTKVDPAASPAAAGLLGCGVMAGLGAAINTGDVTRGDTVAVIGCGGVGDAAIAGARLVGAPRDHRRRHRPTQAGVGARVRRHAHRQRARELDAGRGDPGAHRRLRRRRRHRRGRPPGDVQAGVLRPRPRRHRRAGRGADAGDAPGPAAARLLRPRRRAEVVLVRRLPALARLPDADRPVPAGPADLDEFVSETIGIGDVEEAFDKMQRGEVLRSVVVF